MQFDIRTLLVAVSLASVFSAGARFLLWRMHPGMTGLAQWTWAGFIAPCALVLIAARDAYPTLPLLAIAQLLIVSGLLLVWDGFCYFSERTRPQLPVLIAVLAVTVVAIILAQHERSLMVRSAENAVLVSALSALIARELLSEASASRLAMRATGWVYAANAVFFLTRAVSFDLRPDTAAPWSPGGFAAVAALWWLGMTIATTLGMALMAGERLQASLDRQASSDPLTGIFNRRAFLLLSEKEQARARRHNRPLSLLMMDLDRFKQINDRLGHGGGDAILCRFVTIAERVLRAKDLLCRIGGEEFVAVLPETTIEQAQVAAERLRAAFAQDFLGSIPAATSLPFDVTVSIGISELEPGEDIGSALRRADAALYQAKADGRNRCALAQPVSGRDDRATSTSDYQATV